MTVRPLVLVVLACAAAGCSSRSLYSRSECLNADVQLRDAVQQLDAARSSGCADENPRGAHSCVRWENELKRLAIVCPAHPATLMANAMLSFESQPERAQQYLDQELALPGIHPDAAVLRGRLAIDEGNLPFARRFLAEQVKLAPDHAGLHETYGAALYLSGRLEDALSELLTARTMGAPAWRIAYHLGLVEEANGHTETAITYYSDAVAKNPGFAQAQSRLNALRKRQ
jgi:tetratricopeptide (TPR) repeat protein